MFGSEKSIWSISEEEAKQRLLTISSAQKAIDSLLKRIRNTSMGNENHEFVPKDYQQAIERLLFVLFHLPDDVQSLSLSTSFNFLEREPKTELEYVIRNLQSYLLVLDSSLKPNFRGKINFVFVVQKPYMPEALENNSADHGSGIRRLMSDVIMPIEFGRQGDINLFNIRPHGLKGTASTMTASAIDYPVPIRLTSSIRLHSENLSLTPFLEHTGRTDPNTGLEMLSVQPANSFFR